MNQVGVFFFLSSWAYSPRLICKPRMRLSISVPKFYFININIRLIPVSGISTVVQLHVSGTVKRPGPIFGMLSPTNASYFYHEITLQGSNMDQGRRLK
jgi:hypothetical protein